VRNFDLNPDSMEHFNNIKQRCSFDAMMMVDRSSRERVILFPHVNVMISISFRKASQICSLNLFNYKILFSEENLFN